MPFDTRKLPPFDMDAEEAVLGSILIDDQVFKAVSKILDEEDFFDMKTKIIFSAMKNLKAIDQITLARELNNQDSLENVGGPAYLAHLVSLIPVSGHAEHYAEIVKTCSLKRQILNHAGRIAALAYDKTSPEEALSRGIAGLEEIRAKISATPRRTRSTNPEISIEKVLIRQSKPRVYEAKVNGIDITFLGDDLLTRKRFKARLLDALDFIPKLTNESDWDKYINQILEMAEREIVPSEANKDYEIKEAIANWLDEIPEAKDGRDLKVGAFIRKNIEEREYNLFMAGPLFRSLKQRKVDFSGRNKLWHLIKGWGAIRQTDVRLGEKTYKLWGLPVEFEEEEAPVVPVDRQVETAEVEELPEWF